MRTRITTAPAYAFTAGGSEFRGDPYMDAILEAGSSIVTAFMDDETTPPELANDAKEQWDVLSASGRIQLYAASHNTVLADPRAKEGPRGWRLGLIVQDIAGKLYQTPVGVVMARRHGTDPVTREIYAWVPPELRNQGIGTAALTDLVYRTDPGYKVPFPGDPQTAAAAQKLTALVQGTRVAA